jgi:hypothetical protein
MKQPNSPFSLLISAFLVAAISGCANTPPPSQLSLAEPDTRNPATITVLSELTDRIADRYVHDHFTLIDSGPCTMAWSFVDTQQSVGTLFKSLGDRKFSSLKVKPNRVITVYYFQQHADRRYCSVGASVLAEEGKSYEFHGGSSYPKCTLTLVDPETNLPIPMLEAVIVPGEVRCKRQ